MSALWGPPPPPHTKLASYRTLSPLAGVRVSPLSLGAMSIGDKWHDYGMGSMDKESSFKLLDAYFDAGVSFISHLFSSPASDPHQGELYRHCKQLVSQPSNRPVTSSDYIISQDETSEAFIGEWAEKRNIREQLVIATKVLIHFSSVFHLDVDKWPVFIRLQTRPRQYHPQD